MRKPIIAANWKMHKTIDEARVFVTAVDGLVPAGDKMETVICAPFVHLQSLTELVKEKPIAIGAQNMYFEEAGAFTGEVSPVMLTTIGVDYVIIGHSERRQYFNETDESVHLKVQAAHKHGLIPIVCVGEHLDEREANKTKEVIKNQVNKALADLRPEQIAKSVIAYEPIWAIGTGKSSSAEEANEVIAYIRSVVQEMSGISAANALRIQYGGSVKPENIADFMAQSDIDGALVGGASLDHESFLQLLEGQQG